MVSRTSIANVVSGIAIVVGVGYFCWTRDTESLKWVLAFALGYLFGSKSVKRER